MKNRWEIYFLKVFHLFTNKKIHRKNDGFDFIMICSCNRSLWGFEVLYGRALPPEDKTHLPENSFFWTYRKDRWECRVGKLFPVLHTLFRKQDTVRDAQGVQPRICRWIQLSFLADCKRSLCIRQSNWRYIREYRTDSYRISYQAKAP